MGDEAIEDHGKQAAPTGDEQYHCQQEREQKRGSRTGLPVEHVDSELEAHGHTSADDRCACGCERELEDVLTVQQSTFHLPVTTICRHMSNSLEVERPGHKFGSFELVVFLHRVPNTDSQ